MMRSRGKSWSDELNSKACEVPDVAVSELPREPQLRRRQFISHVGGLTALAATALLCKGRAWAEAPAAPTGWIDIHSHYAPPDWVNFIAANQGRGMLGNTSFLSTFKGWTPAEIHRADGRSRHCHFHCLAHDTGHLVWRQRGLGGRNTPTRAPVQRLRRKDGRRFPRPLWTVCRAAIAGCGREASARSSMRSTR